MFYTIYSYLYKKFYPQQPPNPGYGFQWQSGQPMPNVFTNYDLNNESQPGIYVVFQSRHLDPDNDVLFGREANGPGPVYARPAALSAPMTELVNFKQTIAPPESDETQMFRRATPERFRDIDGFLTYAANCLEIINSTQTGRALIARINAGKFPVFISVGNLNQTASDGHALNKLAQAIYLFDREGRALPRAELRGMVDTRYANINEVQGRYNQLANDMSGMPAYSLFVPEAQFRGLLLIDLFRFQNEPLSGQHLRQWFSDNGYPAFEANLRTMNQREEGILIKQLFLQSLNIALYSASARGNGSMARIDFRVRNEDDNLPGSADFRPPAVGLAHELIHAMHSLYGEAPGIQANNFTTTATELHTSGIGSDMNFVPYVILPFPNEQINENRIRAEWATAANLDQSNVWAAPVRRTIYESPDGRTVAALRAGWHCL